jgi:hypothetical protein
LPAVHSGRRRRRGRKVPDGHGLQPLRHLYVIAPKGRVHGIR